MFIVDEFSFEDETGEPTGKTIAAQASSTFQLSTSLRPHLNINNRW